MAGLKIVKGKNRIYYYARLRKWDGVHQNEDLVALNARNETEALDRLTFVNKYEKYIKAGSNILFPWENENGKIKVLRYTLGKAVTEYLDARMAEKLRIGTIDIYQRALNYFIEVCGRNIPMENISIQHIEIYKKRFQSDSGEYANINLRALKTFLNWAFDHEIIKNIPKIKLVKTVNKPPSYFNEKEWNDIISLDLAEVRNGIGQLKYPDIEHYKRAWIFYYETGCRLSEPFNGVLDSDNWLIIDADKYKTKIQKQVLLNDELVTILQEMQNRLFDFLKIGNTSKINFIKRYSRVFKMCCRMVGINNKRFHNIRDTFAIRRYLALRDIYQVSKELGHTSVTTTEIYAKFNPRRLNQDFPKLLKHSNYGEKQAIIKIRETDIRETIYSNSGIAR